MRILIATVTAGGGHLQAAAALEEAWRSLRPDDALERLDLLDSVSKLQRTIVLDGYLKLVEKAPELYALAFKKTDNPGLLRKLSAVRRRLAQTLNRRFARHVLATRPDVVLSTHFWPPEVLGGLKARLREQAPLAVSVITDFEAHALWMEPVVDLYCVAAPQTKARLVARGVPDEAVAVTGIPIAAKFSQTIRPREVRRQAGLRDDLPTLLVLGGGFGLGPVSQILAQLDQVAAPFQMVVVCGRNEALRRELAVADRRHPAHVLGFVANMQELMAVADLVVTKPGGLTSSEALALGCPLCVVNPIPGQEAANSDFLLEHGAAIKANRLEDLPFRVGELLGAPRLKQMARAAKKLGRPQAATDICRKVIQRMERSMV